MKKGLKKLIKKKRAEKKHEIFEYIVESGNRATTTA